MTKVRGVAQRVMGVAALLLAVGLSAGASADVARPADAGMGPTLARVHLVGGAGVRIKAAIGAPFAPKAKMGLLKTDTVVVPAGEFVIVHLESNNHLVRIDDDVSLKVSDIVLLNAPKTSESLSTQLDRMVSREEKRTAERIAGTYAGRSAGDAAPPETGGGLGSIGSSGSGGGSGAGLRAGSGGGGAGSGGGSIARGGGGTLAPTPKPATRAVAAQPAATAAPSAASPPPAVVAAAPPVAQPSPPPPSAAAAAPQPQQGHTADSSFERASPKSSAGRAGGATASAPLIDTPTRDRKQAVATTGPALPKLPELRACVNRELKRLGLPASNVTLRLRIEGGRIRRVALGGGLATPDCARQLLLDQPYAGADQTWQSVDLPAK